MGDGRYLSFPIPVEAGQAYDGDDVSGFLCRPGVSNCKLKVTYQTKATLEFTLHEAQELVKAFGGDTETTMVVGCFDSGYSGKGLYASAEDYPEDGSFFLGETEPDRQEM